MDRTKTIIAAVTLAFFLGLLRLLYVKTIRRIKEREKKEDEQFEITPIEEIKKQGSGLTYRWNLDQTHILLKKCQTVFDVVHFYVLAVAKNPITYSRDTLVTDEIIDALYFELVTLFDAFIEEKPSVEEILRLHSSFNSIWANQQNTDEAKLLQLRLEVLMSEMLRAEFLEIKNSTCSNQEKNDRYVILFKKCMRHNPIVFEIAKEINTLKENR